MRKFVATAIFAALAFMGGVANALEVGDAWSPGGRKVYLQDSFQTFAPQVGGQSQGWYYQPLTADPWGTNIWDRALNGSSKPGVDSAFDLTPSCLGNTACLTITAYYGTDNQWHSGMLNSVSADGLSGRPIPAIFAAEATVRLPDTITGIGVAGLEPAFWFNTITPPHYLGTDYPTYEHDVFEKPNNIDLFVTQSVHEHGPIETDIYKSTQVAPHSLTAGWHTYGIDSTATQIVLTLGHIVVLVVARDPASRLDPLSLMLGLAVGGQGWGTPTDTTKTYQMQIANLTVWQ